MTKQPIAKKNIFREKIGKVLKDIREKKDITNSKFLKGANAIMQPLPESSLVNSEERALNLIKKVFKGNKKMFGSLESSPNDKNNNDAVIQMHPTTIKTPKRSIFQKNYDQQQEDEIDDEYEKEESSFEDEDDQKYDILKANRYLLYFSSKQEFLAQEFYDQSCKRTAAHMKILMGAFVVVYLFQTLIIISVRSFIFNYLIILLLKGGIAFVMIIFIFWIKSFYKSILMKCLLFILSSCSFIMAVVQGYMSQVKELNTVQSIELVLLFALTSYLP